MPNPLVRLRPTRTGRKRIKKHRCLSRNSRALTNHAKTKGIPIRPCRRLLRWPAVPIPSFQPRKAARKAIRFAARQRCCRWLGRKSRRNRFGSIRSAYPMRMYPKNQIPASAQFGLRIRLQLNLHPRLLRSVSPGCARSSACPHRCLWSIVTAPSPSLARFLPLRHFLPDRQRRRSRPHPVQPLRPIRPLPPRGPQRLRIHRLRQPRRSVRPTH